MDDFDLEGHIAKLEAEDEGSLEALVAKLGAEDAPMLAKIIREGESTAAFMRAFLAEVETDS